MSASGNPNLMDTEPGGESTQYESIKTVTEPRSKDPGQLGPASQSTSSPSPLQSDREALAERREQNRKFGEKMSEQGFGGQTEGHANKVDRSDDPSPEKTRSEQGYGSGSGVGAQGDV